MQPYEAKKIRRYRAITVQVGREMQHTPPGDMGVPIDRKYLHVSLPPENNVKSLPDDAMLFSHL